MGKGFEKEYMPIPENVEKYKILYAKYERLGELIEKETV
jgi:L-ribulokinase